jgi:hypothetical protein
MATLPDMSREAFGRAMRIITLSLVAGVVFFAVVVMVLYRRPALDAAGIGIDGKSLFTPLALFFTLAAIMVSSILPPRLVQKGLQQIASDLGPAITTQPAGPVHPEVERRLFELFQTTHISTLAPLDGAAFFCVISFMLEGKVLLLILALLLLGRILAAYPSESKLDGWLEQRRIELSDIARAQS